MTKTKSVPLISGKQMRQNEAYAHSYVTCEQTSTRPSKFSDALRLLQRGSTVPYALVVTEET